MKTIVVMISVGNRTHITDATYPPLSQWAAKHNYSCILVKDNYKHLDKAPHFNKLVAHKIVPGYDRYIIVDDDLILKKDAPAMQEVPMGFVGLCKDAVQGNTKAKHVKWTGNTGFIVADALAFPLLEEAYDDGVYPYGMFDAEHGIWGPLDQGTLNNVLFKKDKVFELDYKWNYQAVISFYSTKNNGWERWRDSKVYRLYYYFTLLLPFSKNRKLVKNCYGLHMTMGLYPRFFAAIHK